MGVCASVCDQATDPVPAKDEDVTVEVQDDPNMMLSIARKAKVPELPAFTFELHGGSLDRSLPEKVGISPYAIVTVDGEEWCRSDPTKEPYQEPTWNMSQTGKNIPDEIELSVWTRDPEGNQLLCGSVTIPCSEDMGDLLQQEFTLEKQANTIGCVCLSIQTSSGGSDSPKNSARKRAQSRASVGGEFDDLLDAVEGSRKTAKTRRSISMQPGTMSTMVAESATEEDVDEGGMKFTREPSTPAKTFGPTPILGSWTCVATQGLEEFMLASGVGIFQRKIAKAARWPAWDFAANNHVIVFVNHSAIGDLREEIPLGKEYAWKDGKGNAWTCNAAWTTTPDGGTLLISRKGTMGAYTEERSVTGKKLEFILRNTQYNASWGRTFQRD